MRHIVAGHLLLGALTKIKNSRINRKLWLGANINNVGGIYVPVASKPSVRGFIPLQAHLRLFSVHNLHILYNPIDINFKV
jgi:hypothetical protein